MVDRKRVKKEKKIDRVAIGDIRKKKNRADRRETKKWRKLSKYKHTNMTRIIIINKRRT